MSNLRTFIEAKMECPICAKALSLTFANKGKIWRVQKDIPQEIQFPLPLKNFTFSKKQYAYQPVYYFDVDKNTVSLDFINVVDNIVQADVSLSILAMTKDYFNNKRDFCFYKNCSNGHYGASSGYFSIHKGKLSQNVELKSEYLQITVGNTPMSLYNNFSSNTSSVQFNSFYQSDLPVIHMDNEADVVLAVKTLLTFS